MSARRQRGEGEGGIIAFILVAGVIAVIVGGARCSVQHDAELRGARRGAPAGAETFKLSNGEWVTVWNDGTTWRIVSAGAK